MSFFIQNLDKVFEGVKDVFPAKDPWGLGITLNVLRSDHPKWERWIKKHGKKSPLAEVMKKMTAKVVLGQTLDEIQTQAGMRRKKKSTKEEIKSFDADRLIDRAIDELEEASEEGGTLFGGVDLESMKPGIATILLEQGWSGVLDAEGNELEATTENKLRLLGWDGLLVIDEKGEEHFLTKKESEAMPPGFDLDKAIHSGAAEVIEIDGPVRDADGSVMTIPSGKPFGPAMVGDGIAAFVLETAGKQTIALAEEREENAELFGDTPDGEPDASAA